MKGFMAASAAFLTVPALILSGGSASARTAAAIAAPSRTGDVVDRVLDIVANDLPMSDPSTDDPAASGVTGQSVDALADDDPVAASILSPASGAEVVGSFEVSVSRGDTVALTLWVDGQFRSSDSGTDATATFVLDLTGSATGTTHQIQVGDCASGTCATPDEGTVSDTISVVVYSSFGLDVLSASSVYLSPNGDGRNDTVTLKYTLAPSAAVRFWAVNRTTGQDVVAGRDLGPQPAGVLAYTWDGTSGGLTAPDGLYRLALAAGMPDGNEVEDGVYVTVDTTAAGLGTLKKSTARVFPRKDGYRDAVTFSARVSEPAALVQLRVTTPGGKVVRTLTTKNTAAGTVRLTWNGRGAGGKIPPKGTYRYRWLVRDRAGNVTTSATASIKLDDRILRKRTRTRTVTPVARVGSTYVGDCSRLAKNPNGWKGAHGLYSLWDDANNRSCTHDEDSDLVFGVYTYRVPKAIKLGSVKVAAVGRSHAYRSTSALVLLRNSETAGDASTKLLRPAYKTYWTGARSFTNLDFGRTVRWFAVSANGSHYDIRSFKVKWTYYVLGT